MPDGLRDLLVATPSDTRDWHVYLARSTTAADSRVGSTTDPFRKSIELRDEGFELTISRPCSSLAEARALTFALSVVDPEIVERLLLKTASKRQQK